MSNINTTYFSSEPSNDLFEEHQEIGEVCIANISPREREIRRQFAIRQFIVALVILAIMIALQLDPVWRLLLFFLFSASTSSFFQARDKT